MATVAFTTNLTLFVFVKLFPILMEVIDLYGCMLIYGSLCVMAVIFVAIVLKDTTGQNLDDVGLDDQTKAKRAQKTNC